MTNFTVEGKIKGKSRPRFYNGHVITPKDTINYENWVKVCYKQSNGKFYEKSVCVNIKAYYKIPISKTKTEKSKLKFYAENPRPTKKPDVDNVAKIICDSLNGIAYKDDSQITELRVFKLWTEKNERVEISICRFD